VSATSAGTGSSRSPWERWGWAVAAIWLVFLVYPVTETVETDAPTAVRGVVLVLIGSYAAVYLLGWSVWRDHALTIWFAMLLLATGTVPVSASRPSG
jgi:two-component system sensor histidine kinase DesK